MKIQSVYEAAFKKYGKVITGIDLAELIDIMKDKEMPTDGIVYEASVKELEAVRAATQICNRVYGGLPIEIGYCGGSNHKLNGVEYHRGSEMNIACRDMIILIGLLQDVEDDFTYDSSKIEAFLVPAGTGVELYGTTLHYAPCTYFNEKTFCSICILPEGTNQKIDFEFDKTQGENQLLMAKNKWLILHEDAKEKGAFCGVKGENLTI